jgi:hypothetical protein
MNNEFENMWKKSGRKLHNEEFHDLYSSPSIIRMVMSREMRLTEHVASMKRPATHIGFWWES